MPPSFPVHRFPAVLLAALALWPRIAGAEDYRLQPGDVVEVAVVGLPDLRLRSTVDVDGAITVPLAGAVTAAGLTVPELRDRVKELLPARPLRRRTPEGRSLDVVIEPDEVSVTVAEYRPVYVNGDVAKPGEEAFRPGMTVRQAVALAGGYDLVRQRIPNPVLETADLRAQYGALLSELAKQDVRKMRIRAELEGRDDLAPGPEHPEGGAVSPDMLDLARRQLAGSRADLQAEKDYLARVIDQTSRQIATLSEQRQKQQEGVEQQAADAAKTRQLYERGLAPFNRVTDEQRSLLLSSDRLLQTSAQMSQAERLREQLSRDAQKVEEQRRLRLLDELQDAETAIAGLRARLDGVAEKLVYTGALRSQLVGGKAGKPDLALIRKQGAAAERLPATEDTNLRPGDVVEVTLRAPGGVELSER